MPLPVDPFVSVVGMVGSDVFDPRAPSWWKGETYLIIRLWL